MLRHYTVHNLGPYLARRDGGWVCHYCGCRIHADPDKVNSLRRPAKATIDHKTPLARGGEDTPRNLVLACRECNQEKGAYDYVFFRALTRPRRQKARA